METRCKASAFPQGLGSLRLPHFPQPRRRNHLQTINQGVGPFYSIGVGPFYVVKARRDSGLVEDELEYLRPLYQGPGDAAFVHPDRPNRLTVAAFWRTIVRLPSFHVSEWPPRSHRRYRIQLPDYGTKSMTSRELDPRLERFNLDEQGDRLERPLWRYLRDDFRLYEVFGR